MKIKRITIDLDTRNWFIKLWAIVTLKVNDFENIVVKDSPSKRGFHIIGWHKIGFNINELLEIRLKCCDDKARIYFDEQKNRHINILFDKKTVFIFKDRNELIRSVAKWRKHKKI